MNQIQTIETTDNVIELKSAVCTPQHPWTQSVITRLSKQLSREARKHKLNYDQLKRIFVNVRKECGVEVPRVKNKMLELPTDANLQKWFDSISDPIHKLIFQTMVQTGLRVNELVNLEVKHIDLANNQALVKEGKGGKDRMIVIGNKLRAQLEIYLAAKNNRYLFATIRNSKFSKRRIQMLAEEYSAKSGVHIFSHVLRHLYITRMAHKNLNEDQRGVLAGHAKSSRSELQARYTHVTLAGIKDQAIAAIDSYNL